MLHPALIAAKFGATLNWVGVSTSMVNRWYLDALGAARPAWSIATYDLQVMRVTLKGLLQRSWMRHVPPVAIQDGRGAARTIQSKNLTALFTNQLRPGDLVNSIRITPLA